MSFFSVLMLATAPVQVPVEHPAPVVNAITEIRSHHLDTVEGRVAFLVDKMPPFAARASSLNQEIQDLFRDAQEPANQPRVREIAASLQQKMAALEPMLPILNNSTHLNEDFQQIDAVMQKEPPLSENEQEMLIRVAKISTYMESIDLNAAANP